MRTTSRMACLLATALLCLLMSSASAQPANRMLLPFVATDTATVTVLIGHDTTMVTCYVVPNSDRILITYIDRAHGNLLHVSEDVGDHLAELPLPPDLAVQVAGPAPAFTAPGDKQANGCTVVIGSTLKVYATTRDKGDETGPFKLKRLDMPLPAPPQ